MNEHNAIRLCIQEFSNINDEIDELLAIANRNLVQSDQLCKAKESLEEIERRIDRHKHNNTSRCKELLKNVNEEIVSFVFYPKTEPYNIYGNERKYSYESGNSSNSLIIAPRLPLMRDQDIPKKLEVDCDDIASISN